MIRSSIRMANVCTSSRIKTQFIKLFSDIQICNVKPIPEPNPIILATDIPQKISRFYHYNDVKRFQCDRPVHKGIIDKENEIKVSIF